MSPTRQNCLSKITITSDQLHILYDQHSNHISKSWTIQTIFSDYTKYLYMSDGKFSWLLFICYFLIGTLFESVKNLTAYLYDDNKSYIVITQPIMIDVYLVDAVEKFPSFWHCEDLVYLSHYLLNWAVTWTCQTK